MRIAGLFCWNAEAHNWTKPDCLLWLADHTLRTVDFVDAMQIYNVRLHQVEFSWFNAGLAIGFRVAIGFFLFAGIRRIRLSIPEFSYRSADLLNILFSGEHTAEARAGLNRSGVRGWEKTLLDGYPDAPTPQVRVAVLELLSGAVGKIKYADEKDQTIELLLTSQLDVDAAVAKAACKAFSIPEITEIILEQFNLGLEGCFDDIHVDPDDPARLTLLIKAVHHIGPLAGRLTPKLICLIRETTFPTDLRRAAAQALARVAPKEFQRLRAKRPR